mgnify:FL=1
MEIQSGVTHDMNIRMGGTEATHENVTFSDQTSAYMYDIDGRTDPTRTLQGTQDSSLENFFSRPIKIQATE